MVRFKISSTKIRQRYFGTRHATSRAALYLFFAIGLGIFLLFSHDGATLKNGSAFHKLASAINFAGRILEQNSAVKCVHYDSAEKWVSQYLTNKTETLSVLYISDDSNHCLLGWEASKLHRHSIFRSAIAGLPRALPVYATHEYTPDPGIEEQENIMPPTFDVVALFDFNVATDLEIGFIGTISRTLKSGGLLAVNKRSKGWNSAKNALDRCRRRTTPLPLLPGYENPSVATFSLASTSCTHDVLPRAIHDTEMHFYEVCSVLLL